MGETVVGGEDALCKENDNDQMTGEVTNQNAVAPTSMMTPTNHMTLIVIPVAGSVRMMLVNASKTSCTAQRPAIRPNSTRR